MLSGTIPRDRVAGNAADNAGDPSFNGIGDEVLCTSNTTGQTLWSVKLEGDLVKVGGHFGRAAGAGRRRLVRCHRGGQVLRLRQEEGELKAMYEVGSERRFSHVMFASTDNTNRKWWCSCRR